MRGDATRSPLLEAWFTGSETVRNGVMFLDQGGNILHMNGRFAQELGYAPGQFEPKTIFQVNPHFNLLEWRKLWEELESKGRINLETEHVNAAGENVPAYWEAVLSPAEGLPVCVAIVKGSLLATDEDLSLAYFCMDNASDLICWIAPGGSLLYANRSTCAKMGWSKEELLRMKIMDLEPDIAQQQWDADWLKLKAQGHCEVMAVRRTRSGAEFPVRVSANYILFNGKEYNLSIAKDLRPEMEWRELLDLAFQTLKQSADMIYWLNPDGSFHYFNEAFCKVTGCSPDEVQRMHVLDFFPGFVMKEFEAVWNVLRNGEPRYGKIEITCKDGSKVPCESLITLVRFGQHEHSCTVLRDVTERKKEEAERQRLQAEVEALNRKLKAENISLKAEIQHAQGFPNIISKSPAYRKVLNEISLVAETDATALLLGETGTGKELLAKAIHQFSDRSDQPLIKVSCGALPPSLIESELFGHEKGAFTGAARRKAGRFELAHKGTLFLDEVAELPPDLQVKLLRVLQEGEFERVGGTQTIQVDVRLIAATNRNLEEEVRKGNFREDLFYRLNVFPIHNIPLRERRDDIPPLVSHFVAKFNRKTGRDITEIPPDLMEELKGYDFPGNVRELENLVERAVILSKGKTLELSFSFKKTVGQKEAAAFKTMEEVERQHILEALRRAAGKVSGKGGAADLLDLNDKTLTSRMAKLGIGRHDFLKGPAQ